MFERFENLRLDRKVVVLDLEITGANYKTDRIVQFALLTIEPGDIPKVFAAHVDPGVPIPATATAVHGIRDVDVEHAPQFSRHAEEIKDSLDDATLIGYGIKKLHLPMLVQEFGRLGIEFSLKKRLVIDVAQILGKPEPPTLSAALELICCRKHEKPDRAEEDVDAIALLLDGILARNPALPRTITELHDHFAGWGISLRRQRARFRFWRASRAALERSRPNRPRLSPRDA